MELRKLRDKATEAFSKGRFSKAAELYAEYCEKDPKDIQAKLRMGDAWAKAGDRTRAIASYKAAAEAFAREGFLPRAIAASKLILELDPSHTGVQQMLASLYARKGGAPAAKRPATLPEMPAAGRAAPGRSKHEPIELPKDDEEPFTPQRASEPRVTPPPAPPSKYAPIELDDADEALSVATTGASAVVPMGAVELPPELEIFPAAPAAAPLPAAEVTAPPELELELDTGGPAESGPVDEPLTPPAPAPRAAAPTPQRRAELTPNAVGAAPMAPAQAAASPAGTSAEVRANTAPAVSAAPPGLKRRPTAVEMLAVELPAVAVELPRPAPVAPSPVSAAPAAEGEPRAAVSESRAAASDPRTAVSPPPPASGEAPRASATEARTAAPSAPVPLPAPNVVASAPAARSEPVAAPRPEAAPASRIFIPGVEPVAPAVTLSGAKSVPYGKPTDSDLERALSRFDELSLDDAPATPHGSGLAELEPTQSEVELSGAAATPAPVRVPSFTELELEGDSLLHAVEVAAIAGKTQRGEAAEEEEEVFSLTTEVTAEQKDAGELPQIPLFSDLPPDAFIELFERCPLKRYGANERIIAQGSVGDAFYVVCEGAVRVVREELEGARELATLNEGTFFGEMALLSGAPRSASVESASDDTQVLEISAPVLAQLSVRYPSVATALKKFCRQRMLSNVMNTSALFRPFSKSDRRTLVEKFRARDVNKGDVLIRDGAETDGLYIVLSGEVEVLKGNQVLARLHEGELFGEMSLLKKTAASADVKASRRTSLIRLPRADFDALILSHPQILVLISELTDDRQRQNDAVVGGAAEVGDQGLLLV